MNALPQASTSVVSSPLAALGSLLAPGGGEAGGFDQLVAGQANVAVPAAALDTPAFTLASGDPATAEPPAGAGPKAPPKPVTAPPMAADLQIEIEVDAPVAAPKPEATADKDAVAVANGLIGAIGRFAAPVASQPGKTPVAATPGKADTGEETASSDIADTAPVVAWMPTLSVVPDKPATGADRLGAARRDDAPMAPAPKARDATQPLPAVTLASAEPLAAKPVGEASMTVFFGQPATQTAAIAEAAAPTIVAERVLDMTSDDGWIEQLASDIAATKSRSGEVSFRLMPRHLGRLDVAMIAGDEGVSVRMDTHHEATATIVTAAQSRLIDDLRQQGVRVADAQVTCTPGETGRQSQQGQGRHPGDGSAHLIETDRAEPRDAERAAEDRGRFA